MIDLFFHVFILFRKEEEKEKRKETSQVKLGKSHERRESRQRRCLRARDRPTSHNITSPLELFLLDLIIVSRRTSFCATDPQSPPFLFSATYTFIYLCAFLVVYLYCFVWVLVVFIFFLASWNFWDS